MNPNGYIQGKNGAPIELVDATARRQLSGKLDRPNGLTVGGYLRVQSIGEDGTVVLEGASIPDVETTQNAVLYTEQDLTPEQQEQARMNIGAVSITADITTQGEVSQFYATGGVIKFNDNARGCFFNVRENTFYKITVKGQHNRLYVSGCMVEDLLTGSTAVTIYNSNRQDTSTETETCTVNSGSYKSLMVTVCFGLPSQDVSVEYAETKDGVVSLDGFELYTAGKVDQLLEPLGKCDTFYTTESNVDNIATTAGIHALYDALVTKHPDYISKNILGQNSEGASICEYVFTSGDYNDVVTQRPKDDIKPKPTILILSGVHGYERSAVMATYQFFRDMADYSPVLYPLREGITFRVIPVVTPYAFDHDKRVNENGVNINRNFNFNWSLTANDGNDYSGEAAADQAETQIVQAWFETNASATFFVDHHNSGYENEVSMVSGLNTDEKVTELKGMYLQGVGKVIPYWRKTGFAADSVYAYTGFIGGKAMSTDYAQNIGIPSICLETSWNQNATGHHSAATIAVGAEAFGNMLLETYAKITNLLKQS